MKYQTFRLHVNQGPQDEFAAYAFTPRGEGRTTFKLPQAVEWDDLMMSIGHRPQHRDLARRSMISIDSAHQIRRVGELLFSALFSGEVLSLYERSLDAVAAKGGDVGLKIELMFDPRDPLFSRLQAVPWEVLRQPGTPEYLALNRRRPIVRYLAFPRAVGQGWPSLPIRIVALASNPRSMVTLDLERELQNLTNAATLLSTKLEIVRPVAPTLSALRQLCLEMPCDVLHFMGHGGFSSPGNEPALIFETETGDADPVNGVDLANKLADFPSIKLVFLNACDSASISVKDSADAFAGVASTLVLGGMPAVIAMQFLISDESAIAFSRTFYGRLSAGDPIEAAVSEGRQAVHSLEPNSVEWAIPLLFLRGLEPGMESQPRSRRSTLLVFLLLVIALSILIIGLGVQRRENRTLKLNNQGFEELGRGNLNRARDYFEEVIEIDPTYAPAYANLSILESTSGNEKAALEYARWAVQAEPKVAFYHYNLGYILALSKRSEEALSCLLQAIAIDPKYAAAYNELGNSYLDMDRPAEAETAFLRGLLAEPELPDLSKNLGRALLAQGKIQPAISRLDKALRIYQHSDSTLKEAETLWWLAKAHADAQHHDAACGVLSALYRVGDAEKLPWLPQAKTLAQQIACKDLAAP